MAYARPVTLTNGDLVPAAYMRRLRLNWIAYEGHAHSGDQDGAQLGFLYGWPEVMMAGGQLEV